MKLNLNAGLKDVVNKCITLPEPEIRNTRGQALALSSLLLMPFIGFGVVPVGISIYLFHNYVTNTIHPPESENRLLALMRECESLAPKPIYGGQA